MDDFAYMAGLFDGEGSFTAQVDSRFTPSGRPNVRVNPRMSMGLKYGSEVLEMFVERIGGAIYSRTKAAKPADNATRQWVCSKRSELLTGVEILLPYLRIKRSIAERFLELVEIIPTTRKGTNLSGGERIWTPDMVERAARLAFGLNPPSGRWGPRDDAEVARLVGMVS